MVPPSCQARFEEHKHKHEYEPEPEQSDQCPVHVQVSLNPKSPPMQAQKPPRRHYHGRPIRTAIAQSSLITQSGALEARAVVIGRCSRSKDSWLARSSALAPPERVDAVESAKSEDKNLVGGVLEHFGAVTSQSHQILGNLIDHAIWTTDKIF